MSLNYPEPNYPELSSAERMADSERKVGQKSFSKKKSNLNKVSEVRGSKSI